MIHLTLDTDVWLNSVKESGDDDNFIDSLEHWIENNDIKILLPESIIEEWNRNREVKKKIFLDDWKNFFNRSKRVFGNDIVKMLRTPEHLNELVEKQFKRVESIFHNHAINIPITNDYKLKAVVLAEHKKAPFGQKNSIGDAYLFLAITDYIENNRLLNCIFVTNNHTDFSSKEYTDKIHSDLEPEFSKLNIKYYIDLRRFFADYSNHLPDVNEYKKLKDLKEENKKLASAVLNPQSLDNLTGLRDSYIENINHLDIILNTKLLTKEQAKFALELVDSDVSYMEYFFKKVDNTVWFNILSQKGYFNHLNNPSPLQSENGFATPFWQPLIFLEKLSLKIKNGQELELIDEILKIIEIVSQYPKDNYHTWYSFISILINLPNNSISTKILDFIPIWLKSEFNITLVSSEICTDLLIKFLSDNPTNDDIIKAEVILKHCFSIEKNDTIFQKSDSIDKKSYYSITSMYHLKKSFRINNLVNRIIAFCSNDIIFQIADNLKKLRLDFSHGINLYFEFDGQKKNVKIFIENKNINVFLEGESHQEQILDFEKYNEEETKQILLAALNNLNIKIESNDRNVEIATHAILYGSYSEFLGTPISKLQEDFYHSENEIEVFTLILRDLLDEKAKQEKPDTIQILQQFISDITYRLAVFRRISLFVIAENWETTKSIFWEQIKNNDEKSYFLNSQYYEDIYYLLSKNQVYLTIREIEILENIIEVGPKNKNRNNDDNYIEYWKLRWYSALSNIEPFKAKYIQVSESQKITNEHFENLGKIITTVGDTSPFSIEEILQKSNTEIINYIHSFKPKSRWEEPSIDGLAGILGKAIEIEPQRFSNEIELYYDVYYIYTYYIINGFRDAWKDNKMFNWVNVLNFCKLYILNNKFYSGQFSLQIDGWQATSEWVVGAIGNLLTEGCKSDNNAFDLKLLPIAKEILLILVSNLKYDDDFKQTNMDYPMYSLNSTAGKTLRALLDYSLRKGRNLPDKTKSYKWDTDIKILFENSLDNGIIDSYILIGWHFQQFYFLDEEWIKGKVKQFYDLEENKWLAFMSGFAFDNPPFSKEIYYLFYPHYERAIINKYQIKGNQGNGLIRHIATFYFWGYEDLKKEGLLITLLNSGETKSIYELVKFIGWQDLYFNSLNQADAIKFQAIIYNLWYAIIMKFQDSEEIEEQDILVTLLNFLKFISELNENYTKLILKSSVFSVKNLRSHDLIENLVRFIDQKDIIETAKYIAQILISIPFTPYDINYDAISITSLVCFMYENGQEAIADEFCNKVTKQGNDFLIETYKKYN